LLEDKEVVVYMLIKALNLTPQEAEKSEERKEKRQKEEEGGDGNGGFQEEDGGEGEQEGSQVDAQFEDELCQLWDMTNNSVSSFHLQALLLTLSCKSLSFSVSLSLVNLYEYIIRFDFYVCFLIPAFCSVRLFSC
jgi:hypothetical protein